MGTTFRSVAEYSCEIGFDLDGVARVQCLEDGQWSDPAPFCDIRGESDLLAKPLKPYNFITNDVETYFYRGSRYGSQWSSPFNKGSRG